MTLTHAVRNAVRQALTRSREYDADTMVIGRNGSVSARKDADKTFGGNDSRRYIVGHIDDMVTQDGEIREGW